MKKLIVYTFFYFLIATSAISAKSNINPSLDFTYTQNCYTVELTANMEGGQPPYIFEWDIQCDSSIELTGQINTWIFPAIQFPATQEICLRVIDAIGDTCFVQKDIVLQDTEKPSIEFCPSDISYTLGSCQGGQNIEFEMPTFTDNCGIESVVCSDTSGTYFPCGQTIIKCVALDYAGNSDSCSFNIDLICEPATVEDSGVSCNPNANNLLDFYIQIDTEIEESELADYCSIDITSTLDGISFLDISTTWLGSKLTIQGAASIDACPYPSYLPLLVHLQCNLPNSDVQECSYSLNLATVCCKSIKIEETLVCKYDALLEIPLIGCTNFCDVQQVRWYVSDAPCPTSDWGEPFQVSNGCQPLQLLPDLHQGNICVYAELDTGGSDGTCANTYTSSIATFTLCHTLGVSIQNANQTYCYDDNSVTPQMLSALVTNVGDCPYTIRWKDANGIIEDATTLDYQPPVLSVPTGNQSCEKEFKYTVIVENVCGEESDQTTITLQKKDAPVGDLSLNPDRNLPLCFGDDASIVFSPKCDREGLWQWWVSTDGVNFEYLPDAGSENFKLNTNRLFQDYWYQMELIGDDCPTSPVTMHLPSQPYVEITRFEAAKPSICNPYTVAMEVDFTPSYADTNLCSYTVNWRRDGVVIHQDIVKNGPVSYNHTPFLIEDIAGNYSVDIVNTCCKLGGNQELDESENIEIEEPCWITTLGPCFRCNDEIVSLRGILENPIDGAICSYQWYDENGAIEGANGAYLTVYPKQEGPFRFEVSCIIDGETCLKTSIFELKQCGANTLLKKNPLASVESLEQLQPSIFPNPTEGKVFIQFQVELPTNLTLEVSDAQGAILETMILSKAIALHDFDLSNYPKGIYFITVYQDGLVLGGEKILRL